MKIEGSGRTSPRRDDDGPPADIDVAVNGNGAMVARPIRPGQLQGPRPPATHLPPDDVLAAEYEAGLAQKPPITMSELAEKYHVSQSLIHKRIRRVRPEDDRRSRRRLASADPLTLELTYTRSAIELFGQIRENCGDEALRRVITNVRMHLGVE